MPSWRLTKLENDVDIGIFEYGHVVTSQNLKEDFEANVPVYSISLCREDKCIGNNSQHDLSRNWIVLTDT